MQTFSDWNKVPAHLEAKVNEILQGSGTATYDKSFDRNNEPITVYRLADYRVALNLGYLTREQKIKLFDIAAERSIILSSFLHSLSFEIEIIRVHGEIYHLPGMIVGTWPHCNQFGGMAEDGSIST